MNGTKESIYGKIELMRTKKLNMEFEKKEWSVLLRIWLGIFCSSLLCNWGILWLITQNTTKSPHDDTWKGILFVWNTFGVLLLSIGSSTLFLNCLKMVRDNKLCSFVSFFLVPVLIVLWEIGVGRTSRERSISEIAVLCPIIAPFILCLSIGYLLFRYRKG